MRTANGYIDLLRSLGKTVCMRELHEDTSLESIGLRHDVDYSLEKALVVAKAEADRGCRSTYYLLHTTEYWGDENFNQQCRELESMGHEVALHTNFLAQWYRGEITSVADEIGRVTDRLRETGVSVTGWAAHGDPDCYQGQFTNYWHDSDLKVEDPGALESGISAEGIKEARPSFQLRYPEDGIIQNQAGERFELWSISMAEFGYEYHAVHVPHDRYFSDSGGSWLRSGDPIEVPYEGGRWQILVHPEYWLEKPRVFLFTGSLSAKKHQERWKLIDANRHIDDLRKEGKTELALTSLRDSLSETEDTMIYNLSAPVIPYSVGKGHTWKSGQTLYPFLDELKIDGASAGERIFVEKTGRPLKVDLTSHYCSVAGDAPREVASSEIAIQCPSESIMEAQIPLSGWRTTLFSRLRKREVQWECSFLYEAAEKPGGLYIGLRSGLVLKSELLTIRGWLALFKWYIGLNREHLKYDGVLRISSLPAGRRRITFRFLTAPGILAFYPVIRARGTMLSLTISEFTIARRHGGIPTAEAQVVCIENVPIQKGSSR